MKDKIKSILKSNKGFTLVELIIVIAIIAVLSAILVPRITGFVGEARETAQLATARSIWSNAELAGARTEGGGDFATVFQSLFSNDANVTMGAGAGSAQGTIATVSMNNGTEIYDVIQDDDNNYTVTLQGNENITYPADGNVGDDNNG